MGYRSRSLGESYILAGQLAFDAGSNVDVRYLRAGLDFVRSQISAVKYSGDVPNAGFAVLSGTLAR